MTFREKIMSSLSLDGILSSTSRALSFLRGQGGTPVPATGARAGMFHFVLNDDAEGYTRTLKMASMLEGEKNREFREAVMDTDPSSKTRIEKAFASFLLWKGSEGFLAVNLNFIPRDKRARLCSYLVDSPGDGMYEAVSKDGKPVPVDGEYMRKAIAYAIGENVEYAIRFYFYSANRMCSEVSWEDAHHAVLADPRPYSGMDEAGQRSIYEGISKRGEKKKKERVYRILWNLRLCGIKVSQVDLDYFSSLV